jgi:hypothetical protein
MIYFIIKHHKYIGKMELITLRQASNQLLSVKQARTPPLRGFSVASQPWFSLFGRRQTIDKK